MRRFLCTLAAPAAAAVVAFAGGPASAAIISLEVAGVVNALGGTAGTFGPDVAVAGTVQFDTAGAAYQTGPYGDGAYAYYRPISGSFQIGGQTYGFGPSGALSVVDWTTDSITFFDSSTVVGPTTGGFDPWYLALSFNGGPNTVAGTALPASYESLAGLTPYFSLYFNGGYSASLQGYLSVVPPASAVPEPASWALMILGAGLAGATLRRNRQAPPITA